MQPKIIPVYIPYNRHIAPGVVEAVLIQGFTPQLIECTHPETYCRLLASQWSVESFIIIEHDNLLMNAEGELLSLQALVECEAPWCGYEYPLGINTQCELVYETAFGMTCFKDVRLLMPDIWEPPKINTRYPNNPRKTCRHWEGMDIYFKAYADQLNIKQHCHGRGQHLKDFSPPSQDKLKQLAKDLIIRGI